MASTDLNTGKTLDNPKPISAADMWAVLASSGSTAALVIGIFGVMAITSEYTTSAVQSSLTVNPRRGMFYATKSVATPCLRWLLVLSAFCWPQVCSGYSLEAMTLRR